MPPAIDQALGTLGIRDDAYAFLADLGLYAPGQACADGGCQAWYCDLVILGQCYQRRGEAYVPSNPVGCLGNCGGGVGLCSTGTCPEGEPYNCCARPGEGGCGPLLMDVRGTDCCGQEGPPTPTPPPTPTTLRRPAHYFAQAQRQL